MRCWDLDSFESDWHVGWMLIHTTCVQNAGPMSMEIFTGTETIMLPFLKSAVA